MNPSRIALGVIAVMLGVLIWEVTLPESGSVGGFYFPSMCAAALAIGFASPRLVAIALGLVAPQVVLFIVDPPGDNDGLQLLWIPVLLAVGFAALVAAFGGAELRKRLGSGPH